MNSLKLNDAQSLTIEPDGKRVRLVVYKDGVEEVCRKEYLNKLRRFIESDEERLFKGRLQLFRTSMGIGVEVKKEIMGIISIESFLTQLQKVEV